MSFYSIVWMVQKVITRILLLKFNLNKGISSRKTKDKSIVILQTTEEELGLNSYKIFKNSKYRRVLEISNPVINPKTGIVWIGKKILEESTLWDYKNLIKWEPRPIFPQKYEGIFLVLPDNGFFHFLIEDLPRFTQARQLNQKAISLVGSNSKYMYEVVQILKLDQILPTDIPVRVDKLILSEKTKERLFSIEDLNTLRNEFKHYIKSNKMKRVFISRHDYKGAKYISRGIDKKNEIEKIFIKHSFEIHYLEDLTFSEQIRICSEAGVIAGFHGAGLANSIWSSPGTKIIEITKTRETRHFEHISQICSHDYARYSVLNPLIDLEILIRHSI